MLRRLEDQMPWSDEIGRLASCIAIRLDDSAYAIEKARQIAARSQNFQDHVWLGQLLAAEGRQAKRDDAHQGDSAQTLTEAEARCGGPSNYARSRPRRGHRSSASSTLRIAGRMPKRSSSRRNPASPWSVLP